MSHLSMKKDNWYAWDICPCNQALNFLSKRADPVPILTKEVRLASEGAILDEISHELISMYPYEGGFPRGLSNAEVVSTWISYLESRT